MWERENGPKERVIAKQLRKACNEGQKKFLDNQKPAKFMFVSVA